MIVGKASNMLKLTGVVWVATFLQFVEKSFRYIFTSVENDL